MRRVNYLVIGVGDITSRRVIPAIQAEGRSRLRGILTRDRGKGVRFPEAEVFTRLEDALACGEIDAVYVASPVVLHAAQTIASLRAGKHVLCEKPTAMNLREAEAMVAAAEAAGRIFGVAYYRRLYPKLVRAKRLIAEGAIGRPTLVQACYHGWLESEERGWLRDPAMAGGGPLYDVASHRIDAANFLFGKPVRAVGLRSNQVHALGVEDNASVLIDYAGTGGDGVRAMVDVRWNSRVGRDEFRVMGTDGEIDLTPLNGAGMSVNGVREEWPVEANVHLPLIADFTAAVLDGRAPVCPGVEAMWTDWVTEQVMRSR